jgi:lipoyl-dependent peroxiredoxin
MAFSGALEKAGHSPNSVDTTANVHLSPADGGFRISRIELVTTADVPGIDAGAFAELAEAAKQNCPVSKALAGVDIALDATLASA